MKNKKMFTPIYANGLPLSGHVIKHLRHFDQIPLTAPRQGAMYCEVKKYSI